MYHLIGLGSNHDASRHIRMLLESLRRFEHCLKISRIIRTRAEGIPGPDYLNAVALIRENISAQAMKQWCKEQERQAGRKPVTSTGICVADVDLLLSWPDPDPVPDIGGLEPYYRALAGEVLGEQ